MAPQNQTLSPAVFLDRDGTIIVDTHYLQDPEDVELLPGAVAGLRMLQAAGYLLVVVTNQSGIGRGYFSEDTVHTVHARLQMLLQQHEVTLSHYYFCPHAPEASCHCRKPEPGLIERARDELPIDLARSYVIGDKACDVQLGQRLGMPGILVTTGHGAEEMQKPDLQPDAVAEDLEAAARWILHRA